jgi:hypothetical protein
MAKLKAKTRNKFPASKFGLPGAKGSGKAKGKYPMPDKSHAADAEGRATQMVAKGKLSPVQAAKIRHKAAAVLGKHDSAYHNQG